MRTLLGIIEHLLQKAKTTNSEQNMRTQTSHILEERYKKWANTPIIFS